MITRNAVPLAAAAAAALLAAGCHAASSRPSQAGATVKADETQAAAIIQGCLPGNIIALTSASGRKTFIACLAIPQKNQPAFTSCLTSAAEKDHVVTSSAGRRAFAESAAPACAEKYR